MLPPSARAALCAVLTVAIGLGALPPSPASGAPLAVRVSPNPIDFGFQHVGAENETQAVSVVNLGPPVDLATPTVTGDSFALFDSTCGGLQLGSGESCDSSVVFTPSGAGPRSGTFEIRDATGTAMSSVAIQGSGSLALAILDPPTLDFGEVEVGGSSSERSVSVAASRATLHVSAVSLDGPDFQRGVGPSSCGAGTTVPPGFRCDVLVTFAPERLGILTGTVAVSSDDVSGTQVADLRGVGTTAFYFAEGTVRDGFEEFLTVQNPTESAGTGTVTFQASDDGGLPVALPTLVLALPPLSRVTRNISDFVRSQSPVPAVNLSMKLTSSLPVVAERPLYFRTGLAGGVDGATVVVGAESPSLEALFAEGTVREGFAEFLTLQNPGTVPGTARVVFQAADDGGSSVEIPDLFSALPGNSRVTLDISRYVSEQHPPPLNLSMRVTSTRPMVAERPLYFRFAGLDRPATGGTDILGAPRAASRFLFAEGTVRPGFMQFLTIQNPRAEADVAHVSFQASDDFGEPVALPPLDLPLPPSSRVTRNISEEVSRSHDGPVNVSMEVRTGGPTLVERPLYFATDLAGGSDGGTDVVGIDAPSVDFAFAEGTVRPGFVEFVTLQNPGTAPGTATLDFQVSNDAGEPVELPDKVVDLPPSSRVTVNVNEHVAESGISDPLLNVSLRATSNEPMVAERPMYFSSGLAGGSDGGTDVVGYRPLLARYRNPNLPPVADAGESRGVGDTTYTPGTGETRNRVSLDGSASFDPDNGPLPVSFSWRQTGGPSVSIDAAKTATPSFDAPDLPLDQQATLLFELSVSDGRASAEATVPITVSDAHTPPVAAATLVGGRDEHTADESATVTLDGSLSTDPDGDPVRFTWQQVAGPALEFLDPATSPSVRVNTPAVGHAGDFVAVRLIVDDRPSGFPLNRAGTTEITFTVSDVNAAPAFGADPGGRSFPEVTQTCAPGPFCTRVPTSVTFTVPAATDADGDALTTTVSQVAGPALGGITLTAGTVRFTAPEVPAGGATITIEARATDGLDTTALALPVVITNVNAPPLANAGTDVTAVAGSRVELSGLDSRDQDGDSLAYVWRQTAAQPNVACLFPALTGNASAMPSFLMPVCALPGNLLTFHLTVTESTPARFTSTDTVIVRVTPNTPPEANAGPDQKLRDLTISRAVTDTAGGTGLRFGLLRQLIVLDGSKSFDPDPQPLRFRWSQISGTAVALPDPTDPVVTFTAPAGTSTMLFRLTVSDTVTTRTDDVTVTIGHVNQPPRFDPLPFGVTDPGSSFVINSRTVDPDLPGQNPSALQYGWVPLTSTSIPLTGPDTAFLGFDWPESDPQQLAFEVTATDTEGASTTERVVITAPPGAPLTATMTAPASAPGGSAIGLHASASRAATFSWSQAGGQPGTLSPTAGADVTFTLPSAGPAVTVAVTVTSGDEDVVVTRTVGVETTRPVTADAGGDRTVVAGTPGVRLAGAGTGAEPLSYTWSQASGPAVTLTSAGGPDAFFDAPGAGASLGFRLVVSDATGASATDTVTVGVAPPAGPGAAVCQLFDQVLAGSQHLTFTVNGYVSFDATATLATGVCPGAATITISGGTFTLFDTIRGTGISGTITSRGSPVVEEVCLAAGTFSLPADWKVPPFSITEPVCHDWSDEGPKKGKAKSSGFPRLNAKKAKNKAMSLIFGEDNRIGVDASMTIGSMSVAAVTGTIERDLDFDLTVTLTDVARVGGQPLNLTGHLARDAGRLVSGTIAGSIGQREPGRTTGAGLTDVIDGLPGLRLEFLEASWSEDLITAEAGAWLGDDLRLGLAGAFEDSDNWTLFAALAGPWSPVPGFTVDSLLGRVEVATGTVTVDVTVHSPGFTPIPGVVTVSDVTLRAGNSLGEISIDVTGTIGLAGAGVSVTVVGTVAVSSGRVDLQARTPLDNWEVIPGAGIYLDAVTVLFSYERAGGSSITMTASARLFGETVTATVSASSAGVIVDIAAGDRQLVPGVNVKDLHAFLASYAAEVFPSGAAVAEPSLALVPNVPALSGRFELPDAVEDFLGIGPTEVALEGRFSLDFSDLYLRASVATSTFVIGDETSEASLRLTSAFIEISLTGVGIGATADLRLPDNPGVLALTAKLAFDFTGPAIRGSFAALGDWVEPFGIKDLTLADLAAQFGINFGTVPPTPTFGFAVTVKHLPDGVAEILGVQPDETITIVANIDATQPIFALKLGAQDGVPSLRPSAPAFRDYLALDFADIAIAPRGGTVGSHTFAPGVTLRFAATILGTEVDFDAIATGLDSSPPLPAFRANVSIGKFSLGPLDVTGTVISVEISSLFPTIPSVGFQSTLGVPGGFTLRLEGGFSAGASGIRFAVSGRITDLVLGGVTVKDLHASTAFGLGQGAAFAELTAGATIDLFGTTLTIDGSFRVSSGAATGIHAAVSTSPITVVPGVMLTSAGSSTSGPSLVLDYDGTNFAIALSGALRSAGAKVAVSGIVDNVHASLTGTLSAGTTFSIAVAGDLFYGDPAGRTVRVVGGGTAPATAGDFYFASTANAALPVPNFSISVSAEAGRAGGTFSLRANGAASFLGRTVSVAGSISGNGQFSLTATTSNLFGFGETIAINASNSGFGLSTNFGLGPFQVALSGSVRKTPSAAFYTLAGTGAFSVPGFSNTATFSLSNEPGSASGLRVDLTLKVGGNAFVVRLLGELTPNGRFALSAYGSISLPGLTTVNAKFTLRNILSLGFIVVPIPLELRVDVSIDSGGLRFSFGGKIAFSGAFSITAQVQVTGRTDKYHIDLDKHHKVFGEMTLLATGKVSNSSFSVSFAITGKIREYRKSYVPGSDWTGPHTLASVSFSASVRSDPLKVCVSVSAFGGFTKCTPSLDQY